MKKLFTLLALIFLLLTLMACTREAQITITIDTTGEDVYVLCSVEGTVIETDDMIILVDSIGEVKGLIWVTINNDTIFNNVSSNFEVDNEVCIHVGDKKESYPLQADAVQVFTNYKSA